MLLERIEAEKQGLYAEGKISKPKKMPPIRPDEVPFGVPEGWAWVRIGALGEINPRNDADDDQIVAFCPMALLPEQYGGALGFEKRTWREIKKGYTHFADDDVVVAKITPCFQNGKATVMRGLPSGIGAGTTELHVFRPIYGTIVPEYVLIFLKSPGFVEGGVRTMTGTAGQQRVSKDYFIGSTLPLPPLPEQRRIVEKVDQLMALCDELEERQRRRVQKRDRLNRAALHQLTTAADDHELARGWERIRENFELLYYSPETVAELRQAVLQLAVRGKLVPQDPSDEPASALLERIEAEKERLYAEGKIAQPKKLPAVAEGGLSHLIPPTWQWAGLGTIVEGMDSGWSPACPSEPTSSQEQWGVLRTTSVQPLEFWQHEHKRLPEKLSPRPENEVHKGDLLVTRAGPKNRVGISCVVQSTRPKLMISDKIIRCRPIESHLYPPYLALCLNAGASAEYVERKKSGMAESQVNISQANLAGTPIPLPPLPEQRRIVEIMNQLMALCDELETTLTRARISAERLALSVVQHLIVA